MKRSVAALREVEVHHLRRDSWACCRIAVCHPDGAVASRLQPRADDCQRADVHLGLRRRVAAGTEGRKARRLIFANRKRPCLQRTEAFFDAADAAG